ncbi:hypothetical protein L3C95_21275 [Chitinophaga filiformis]|uniref:hypothetical protein n=1 Tax=Chitinophaga filiformis TaxID=104663 RepID=UPI001F23A300|nr:hypothetical protein [Chitinophaga filiformis]MCF6405451.1 hypothetical protein [Chitinophaga filiformis]
MKTVSYICLSLAIVLLLSCSARRRPCADAWLSYKGNKISLCDDLKKLEKEYDLSVDEESNYAPDGQERKLDHYWALTDDDLKEKDRFYQTCSIAAAFDRKTGLLSEIDIMYFFWGKVTADDLNRLSKRTYLGKFKKRKTPFSVDEGNVHYEVSIQAGEGGTSQTVHYIIQYKD